jgi:GGDEF domain-containing protein
MPAIGLPWFPSTNAAPGPNSGSVPNIQIPASADVPTTNVLTAEAPPAVLPKSEDKLPPPVELDPATMETVFKAVSVEGVGLLSYPAFQFFLVREFMRFRQSSSPFAVAIFQLSVNYGREEGLKPISSRAIREAARRAFSVMQPLDLLAQYQTSDFAFLLPGLNKADAKKFVQKFHETIFASPLLSSVDPQTLLMYAGIAAIPEDCIHPGILLAAAEKAKTKAHELNVPVMLFAD